MSKYEFVERKSRFISYAAPVFSDVEAQAFIAKISADHRAAAHNVYAYYIEARAGVPELQRSNDDGEPSGTAGRPVLEAIKKAALGNVAIVVTRYFGGILLGAGGLTRAYGRAAAEVLAAAEKVILLPAILYQISFSYSLLSKIERLLTNNNYYIKEKLYLDRITFNCLIPADEKTAFEQKLCENSPGEISCFVLSENEIYQKPCPKA